MKKNILFLTFFMLFHGTILPMESQEPDPDDDSLSLFGSSFRPETRGLTISPTDREKKETPTSKQPPKPRKRCTRAIYMEHNPSAPSGEDVPTWLQFIKVKRRKTTDPRPTQHPSIPFIPPTPKSPFIMETGKTNFQPTIQPEAVILPFSQEDLIQARTEDRARCSHSKNFTKFARDTIQCNTCFRIFPSKKEFNLHAQEHARDEIMALQKPQKD